MFCQPPPPVDTFNSNLVYDKKSKRQISFTKLNDVTSTESSIQYIALAHDSEIVISKYEVPFSLDMRYNAYIKKMVIPSEIVLRYGDFLNSYFLKHNIMIKSILPIEEGGIEFEFNHNDSFYNITLENEGMGLFYVEQPNATPEGWDYDFKQLKDRIEKEFI